MTCANTTTYDALIRSAASAYGLDPALIKAHMSVESNFNPHATNLEGSGANPSSGLMQIRLSTARALGYPGEQGNSQLLSGLYNPALNVPLAAKLIRENLDRAGGDVERAISAYNGGWNATKGFGYRLAGGLFGNQRYVDQVRACYAQYAGAITSPSPFPSPSTPPPTPTAGTAGTPVLLMAVGLAAVVAFLFWLRQRV
jgi:soluble lytic murein transglycosylase-like protein